MMNTILIKTWLITTILGIVFALPVLASPPRTFLQDTEVKQEVVEETKAPPVQPKTTAVAPPAVPVASGSCATEIKKYNWPQEAAYQIMMIESGNNAGAHNYNDITRDDSWGCFQINIYPPNNRTRPSATWLANATNNVSYAYRMYKSMGTFCGTGGWFNTCTKLGYHGIY